MSRKFLRVNPKVANIAANVSLCCALLASAGACWYFILFFLLPYLYNHIACH